MTPASVPISPISAPWIRKIFITLAGLAPSVRRIAMSACLSFTAMNRLETILKAATAMIRNTIRNIMRFSMSTARKKLAFSRVQSVM